MAAIAAQLRDDLPLDRIRTAVRVKSIHPGGVVLVFGETIDGCAVVLAAEGPETARLLGSPQGMVSRGELCLYFASKKPPIAEPYLIHNGDGTGWVNSLTVPSIVAPTYAPAGQHLISTVVIGHLDVDDTFAETIVFREFSGLCFQGAGPLNRF